MKVSIVYARPERPILVPVELPEGTTVREAIESSGITRKHPEINLETQKVGIFGKVTALDALVDEGARIEIYVPITADPATVKRRPAPPKDKN